MTTAIFFAACGVVCLIVAGFLIHPAAGLGIAGVLLLSFGLLIEYESE